MAETANGMVNISDEVVAIVASLAAGGIKGVAGMGSSIAGNFAELLGKKNPAKGVKVEISEKSAVLDLFIIVEYGAKVPEVAWNIQEKVKGDVESMTGLTVTAVNVHVEGVVLKGENKEIVTKEIKAEALETKQIKSENEAEAETTTEE